MNAFATVGQRTRSSKPFWKRDAFWFVGIPTSLIAVLFLIAMVAGVAG